MSALRARTAGLLLDHIPGQERLTVVRDVAQSLDAQSSNADIGLAAALLKLHPDHEAQAGLVSHLRQLIEQDGTERIAAVCKEHAELEHELLLNTITRVSDAADLLQSSGQTSLAVALPGSDHSPVLDHAIECRDGAIGTDIDQTVKLLSFLHRVLHRNIETSHITSLLRSCLILVGAVDKTLSHIAKETLFSLFDLLHMFDPPEQEAIWNRVASLATHQDAYYKSLGFSLWLRWLSAQPIEPSILRRPDCWDLIVDGLRKGDSERRKCSLQILRASINASLADPLLTSIIVAESLPSPPTPEAIQKQYNRFASTFETIVLGRYLNQVMECEADLDFLSSSHSVVKPVFLYTLLASALDQRLQESNRKFIGTWIMRSTLRDTDADQFMLFFRNDFLPWVAAGTLFTSSLVKQAGVLRSQHGHNLALYVASLLQTHPQHAGGIIDCILDGVLGRHGNNFPYAMVYLVEGIGQALESDSRLELNVDQLHKLHKIATYSGLPEVVRDYALARCWKLCYEHIRSHQDEADGTIISASKSWHDLQTKSDSLGPTPSTQKDGTIASLALAPSKRETNEQIALGKCQTLVEEVSTTSNEEKLNDIWSDLEYLEYPKGLVAAMPELVLHPRLVEAAIAAPSHDNALAETISKQTKSILELAGSRSYLLPTLAASVRAVALRNPQSAALLNVDELILHIAGHPPSPTTDALLEEATINLLRPIDQRTSKFNYEFYSGRRESYGFAALIDLSSRLDAHLSRQILDTLLQRWLRQKTPVPSVSHWKTALQLQVMLLCSERLVPIMDPSDASCVLEHLHYILSIEPLPTYRYLIEWMIARIYMHHPTLRIAIIERLQTKDHHSNPKFLASLMKLGVMIAKTESSAESFALQLATTFVPLAASSKVVIRHEAQWQVPILLDHARKQNWTSITGTKAFEALDDFIRSLERYEDPPLERQIDRLDPIKDHHLTHLVAGAWWALDQVEQPRCSHADFLDLYATDTAQGLVLPTTCMPLGPAPSPEANETSATPLPEKEVGRKGKTIDSIAQTLLNEDSSTTALQTKGAAYLSNTRTRHSNLFVIASLVDNPYNLGGLSRASEIFGAGALYLTNPQVTSAKDFVSTSVSSHHHIPIRPLAADAIAEFVTSMKKKEGFSVVGIEQTDRSVMLGEANCVLPEKCILVLGSEREGIPPAVLSECDVLVEIRQIGLTRSLNVQTAASIVLCEYARQHKK